MQGYWAGIRLGTAGVCGAILCLAFFCLTQPCTAGETPTIPASEKASTAASGDGPSGPGPTNNTSTPTSAEISHGAPDGAASQAQPACSDAAKTDCGTAVSPFVMPSKRELKAAHRAFERGLKLQKSEQIDEAFYAFEEAASLAPQDAEYVAAREMTREHLARQHIDRGNGEMLKGRQAEALAEFRSALSLDPQNEFAQQRMLDAAGPPPKSFSGPAQVVASQDSLAVSPAPGVHDFHYRGDSQGLLTAVALSYGLSITFDESFQTRRVRFDIEQADFATAMHAACAVTKSFAVPVEDTVLFAAADTSDNHRLFDRMGMRVFRIPTADASKDLQDIVNALRGTFEFRFVMPSPINDTITVRAPLNMLRAATQFVEGVSEPLPEVLLDIQVMEVDHTYAKNIGLHVPDQFNLYNIPVAALASLGGQNAQNLINQLISSGGINQAGNASIAALLSQLGSQQSGIFSQPLATFGGGLTLSGLSLDHLAAVLSMNESSVQSLDHVTLRASQGKEATFKLGERYPVLNASFSPISNSSAIAGVLGNQSYVAPFPSVNYEDIGLTLKAKPMVHQNSDVSLELSLQLRALGTTSVNGVPIITSREFTGGIYLKDGEPAFVAGMVTTSDQRSLDGLPTFAQIPGFGLLTSQHSHQSEEDELLILITPHVLSDPRRADAPPIWVK